ncbi:MAG: hypothetical protein ACM3VT_09395 [Solirubrobacterales bacterium]
MTTIADEIRDHLKPLVGLRLSLTTRTAEVRCFHFGELREIEQGAVGRYALHVQCPWRIEGPDGLVTGHSDLWEPLDEETEIDCRTWDYDANENLQDELMDVLMQGYDPMTGSFADDMDMLVVEAVGGDPCGGATLTLSGGVRLVLFPAGTRGEDWRIFRPGNSEPHFIIAGGRVETGE